MTNNDPDIRRRIDEFLSAKKWIEASRALKQAWQQQPTPAMAGFVVSRYERLRDKLPLAKKRLALLRSFTLEPAVPLLRASALVAGIDLTVQVGDFNAYHQEILNPESALYRFEPDIVMLAIQTRDIAPQLWYEFAGSSAIDLTANLGRIKNDLHNLIQTFRSRSDAHLVLHNFEMPLMPSNGICDGQNENGQIEAIQQINVELAGIAREVAGVYILDYEGLIGRYGRMNWHDERKWLTMRMPIAADCLPPLVDEWMRFIHPLTGRTAKALVVDLDNTLWGGVVGEDGVDGIKLGIEYPGAAYLNLQRAILDLYQRGIILAICSKNNFEDAMSALEKHPHTLLRPKHFASLQINWRSKSENLRAIASELNIGLETLVFLDDNPVERAQVRLHLPQVHVIELPDEPIAYACALRQCPLFERVSLAAEDKQRGQYYAGQRQRVELEKSSGSVEEFNKSLQMIAEISEVDSQTLARVAQLTQKTNQFNLTTRRYSEQEIERIAHELGNHVYHMRVKDRFGDNGIVGVAITRRKDDTWEIDTLLLSCRVIGRTVETALLATIAEHAKLDGVSRLLGWFFPTKKNAPAREFYPSHGFECTLERPDRSCWELNLATAKFEAPAWIERHINVNERNR